MFNKKIKFEFRLENQRAIALTGVTALFLAAATVATAADDAIRGDCDKPETAKAIADSFYTQRDTRQAAMEANQRGYRATIASEADANPDRAESFTEVSSSFDYLHLEEVKKQHEENYKALLQQLRLQLDNPRLNPKSKPACASAMNALADLQRIGEIDKEQFEMLEKAPPYTPPPSEPPPKKKWPW